MKRPPPPLSRSCAPGVRRAELLQALAAQLPPDAIHFGAGLKSIDVASQQGGVTLTLEDGRTVTCRALVGADGVRSAVSRHLGLPRPNYAGAHVRCFGDSLLNASLWLLV